eukprot:00316_6
MPLQAHRAGMSKRLHLMSARPKTDADCASNRQHTPDDVPCVHYQCLVDENTPEQQQN